MKLDAKWTQDCQGKQDYDAELVSLSTRYWPRGGGFFSFNTATGGFKENKDRPELLPSAHASILIQGERIVEADFEAETEGEVKARVEAWAQEKFYLIERALRAALASSPAPDDAPAGEAGS